MSSVSRVIITVGGSLDWFVLFWDQHFFSESHSYASWFYIGYSYFLLLLLKTVVLSYHTYYQIKMQITHQAIVNVFKYILGPNLFIEIVCVKVVSISIHPRFVIYCKSSKEKHLLIKYQ